jgi:hypothetical protein
MKKGVKIYAVHIEDGKVTAMDADCNSIKLTRTQRNILQAYKKPGYIENIIKEFNNPGIIHNDFTVVKQGKIVYTYTR